MVGVAVAILLAPLVLWGASGLGLLYAFWRSTAEAVLRLAALFVALWSLLATTALLWVIAHGGLSAIPTLLASPALLFAPSAAPVWALGAIGAFLLFAVAFLLNQAVGRGFLLLYRVEELPWPEGLARPSGRAMLGRVDLGRPAAFSFTLLELRSHSYPVPSRREVILVSEELLSRLTPGELRAVVAHELGHVRRLDSRYLTFLRTLARLFRWDPVFAAVARSLTKREEVGADAAALELTGDPGALARALGHTVVPKPRRGSERASFPSSWSLASDEDRILGERIRNLRALEGANPPPGASLHA
jgi:Zn-dependent protease with chaperone function